MCVCVCIHTHINWQTISIWCAFRGQQTFSAKDQVVNILDLMDMSLSKLWELMVNREAWHAAVYGVGKSWTRLSNWTELRSNTVWQLFTNTVCEWSREDVFQKEFIYKNRWRGGFDIDSRCWPCSRSALPARTLIWASSVILNVLIATESKEKQVTFVLVKYFICFKLSKLFLLSHAI